MLNEYRHIAVPNQKDFLRSSTEALLCYYIEFHLLNFYNYTHKKRINVPSQFISMINLVPSTGKKKERKKDEK